MGYDYDAESGCLKVNPDEESVVRRIFEMYVSRQMGASSIARWLNEQGYRTKRQARWRTNSVLVVLTNRTYLGEVPFRDENYPGQHPPIIEADRFERAQSILGERGRDIAKRRRNRSEYPLAGLLICSKCSSRFVGAGARGNGGKYRYYACSKRQAFGTGVCDQDRIPAEKLEHALFGRLLEVLGDSAILRRAANKFADAWNETAPNNERESKKITKEIRETQAAIDKYLRAFEEGTMPIAAGLESVT